MIYNYKQYNLLEKRSIIDPLLYALENNDKEMLDLIKDKLKNINLSTIESDDYDDLCQFLTEKEDVKYLKYLQENGIDLFYYACLKMGIFDAIIDKLSSNQKEKYKEYYVLQKDFDIFDE